MASGSAAIGSQALATSRPARRSSSCSCRRRRAAGRGIRICSDRQPGAGDVAASAALEDLLQLKALAAGRVIRICGDRQPSASDVAAGAVLEQLQLKAPAAGCVIRICGDRQEGTGDVAAGAVLEELQLKVPARPAVASGSAAIRQPGASDVTPGAELEQLQLKAQACGRPWHPDLQRSSTRRWRRRGWLCAEELQLKAPVAAGIRIFCEGEPGVGDSWPVRRSRSCSEQR
ncbi:hypothetical protein ACFSR7_05845 [Cohnella sp. GCM10020058]|uniref:hypothetical protein n=1 Tax=Cohnella sp. GCM10020058 TaxID=3317330 RepID=UPI00362750EE